MKKQNNDMDVETQAKLALYVDMFGYPMPTFDDYKTYFISHCDESVLGLSKQELEIYIEKSYKQVIFENQQNFKDFVDNFDRYFATIDKEKYKIVLIKRYGLFRNSAQTLVSIGNELNVSAESVRHMQHNACRTLKYNISQIKYKERLSSSQGGTHIADTELSGKCKNALYRAGFTTLEKVVDEYNKSGSGFLHKIKGLGANSKIEIIEYIYSKGLATNAPGEPSK